MILKILLLIVALIVILLHFSVVMKISLTHGGLSVHVKYLVFDIYPRKPKKAKAKKPRKKEKRKKEKIEREDFSKVEEDTQEDIFVQDDLTDDFEPPVDAAEYSHEEEILDSKQEEREEPKPQAEKKEREEKREKKRNPILQKINSLKKKYEKYKPYIPMTWKYVKKLLKNVRITVDDVRIEVGREDAHEAAIYYGIIQGTAANLLSALSEIFTVGVKKLDVNCVFTQNTIDGECRLSVRARPSAIIAIAVCTIVNFLIIRRREKKKVEIKEPSAA